MPNELTLVQAVCEDIGFSACVPEEIDKRVKRLLKNGAFELNDRAGAEIDYSKDKSAAMLLTRFCVFAHSQAENLFYQDYASELLELRLKYLTKDDENAQE